MHPTEEFDLERDLPPESEDLVEDLGLGTLFGAMARGDKFILTVARAAVLSCLSEPDEIQYRQEVLADLTAHPQPASACSRGKLANSESSRCHRARMFGI